MVQIIPTLFSTTEQEYLGRLAKLKFSTSFQEDGWVQLDLMDGKFVPKIGINLEVVKKNPPPFKMEAQLMVVDPNEWLDGLIELKVKRIIFPIEIDVNISEFIKKIKDNNIEVGLSLNPETEVDRIDPYLNLINACLLMGVKPGMEHQEMDTNVYKKIIALKQKRFNLRVGVDGGVKDTNIKELVEAGADYLAIGSYLFHGDFDENLETLWEALRLRSG